MMGWNIHTLMVTKNEKLSFSPQIFTSFAVIETRVVRFNSLSIYMKRFLFKLV